MTGSEQRRSIHTIFELIRRWLHSNPATVIDLLFDVFQHIPLLRSLPGMYEVLDYEAKLELCDDGGHTALYTKRQQVRFLQNNIIAYQDAAWGDGDIFADYRCSPGVPVDCYREGHRYTILISLRETKRRDDELTFHINRKIRNGFTAPVEEFVTEIDHRTRGLALHLIFPQTRLPANVNLIEKHARRTTPLGVEHRQQLPDGRVQYGWKTARPRLFEAYSLRWEW